MTPFELFLISFFNILLNGFVSKRKKDDLINKTSGKIWKKKEKEKESFKTLFRKF